MTDRNETPVFEGEGLGAEGLLRLELDGVGRLALRDPARPKGLRSEGGYAVASRLGTGGTSLVVVVLRPLNSLFIEAKDDFREGAEVIEVAADSIGA